MYQYEMNDKHTSDFTLIWKEHAIESINDFSSIFCFTETDCARFRRL